MRNSVMPVAAFGLGVAAVLIGTMAAHDPYWRLFEASSVPAPVYESPADLRAVLATAVVAKAHPDRVASRPDTAGDGDLVDESILALMAPRPAEPLVAVPVALADPAIPALAATPAAAVAQDPTSAPTLASALAPDPILAGPQAPSPLAPVGMALADAAQGAPSPGALDPVAAGPAPAPLWSPADATSEEALALARAERANVQRRLALAGFDPKGFDGVFGPRTRQAIRDFQAAWGYPVTGYLDGAVHAELEGRTEEAYAALASRAETRPRAAPKLAPVARERELALADSGGCARNASGRIVERQSFTCDLKGLAEKVVSLGRSKLPHEESVAVAGGAGFGPGADR